jgi:transcriptional regulator GlxA family with amidase domain
MAAAVGLDAFKFGRRFKQSTGMTPHRYVTRCRVRRAMKLLAQGDLGIVDIALEVGCACQSHFTSLFRKHTGTTPGVFRRVATGERRLLYAASTRGSAKNWPLRQPQASSASARQ